MHRRRRHRRRRWTPPAARGWPAGPGSGWPAPAARPPRAAARSSWRWRPACAPPRGEPPAGVPARRAATSTRSSPPRRGDRGGGAHQPADRRTTVVGRDGNTVGRRCRSTRSPGCSAGARWLTRRAAGRTASSRSSSRCADGTRLAATLYLPAGRRAGAVRARGAALPQGRPDRRPTGRSTCGCATSTATPSRRVDVRGTGSSDGLATDEYPAQEQQRPVRGDRLARRASRGAPARSACTARRTPASTRCSSRPSGRRRSRRSARSTPPTTATPTTCTTWAASLRLLDLVDYPTYMVAMNALPPVPALVGDGWRDDVADAGRATSSRGCCAGSRSSATRPYWRHGSVRPGVRPDRAARRCSSAAGPTATATTRSAPSRRWPRRACRTGCCSARGATCRTATSLPGPHIDLVPVMARWWDRWLRGDRRRVRRRAGADLVRASGPPGRAPTARWSTASGGPRRPGRWPARGTTTRGAGRRRGGLRRAARRRHGGVEQLRGVAAVGPADRPALRRRGLADLGVAGGRTRRCSATRGCGCGSRRPQPVATVSAKLCDVFPDGTSSLLTRGLLNLTHRASLDRPEPLPVGEWVDVEVELEAMAWDAGAGHRLRLSVAGVDWPNTVAPPRPLTLTLDRVRVVARLPVAGAVRRPRPGRRSLRAPPDAATDPGDGRHLAGRARRARAPHRVRGRPRQRVRRRRRPGPGALQRPGRGRHRDVRAARRRRPRTSPSPGRRRPSGRGPTSSSTPARTSYDVDLTVETWQDGEPFASRRWTRRIPRDLA